MKIQTFSIVAGTNACNAKCPYCVSKMTPKNDNLKPDKVNFRNFEKACHFAKMNNVSTVLITGKGEPTLYPLQISRYLEKLKPFNFPFIELQTNGTNLIDLDEYLKEWYALGLTTISFSIVHYNEDKNLEIFGKDVSYPRFEYIFKHLHELGYTIRLSCFLMKNYIDNNEEVSNTIEFARRYDIEQLTIRKLGKPKNTKNKEISKWIDKHSISDRMMLKIRHFITTAGNKLMTLPHGAEVYDVIGQNVCLTDCLTIKPNTDDLRQIIFFPDGHLYYDWQYKGAILL